MSTNPAVSLATLKQLLKTSVEMYSFAEQGDWTAVLKCDETRRQILEQRNDSGDEDADQSSLKILKDKILDFDARIQELATTERKLVMNQEIRQQAQVAAQTSYKKALHQGTSL